MNKNKALRDWCRWMCDRHEYYDDPITCILDTDLCYIQGMLIHVGPGCEGCPYDRVSSDWQPTPQSVPSQTTQDAQE